MSRNLFMIFSFLIIYGAHPKKLSAQPYIDTFDLYKGSYSSFPLLYGYGNTLYFTATGENTGRKLWAFYQQATQPTRLTDVTSAGGDSKELAAINNVLYYVGIDSQHGHQIWALKNGVATRITNFNPNAQRPGMLLPYNDDLYFVAERKMWRYNTRVKYLKCLEDGSFNNPYISVYDFGVFNNKVQITGFENPQKIHLYEYDLSTDRLSILASDINANHFTTINNKQYFSAYTDSFGTELYVYDGVTSPVRVTDLNPGKGSGVHLGYTILMNGELYFGGFDSNTKFYQLFKFSPLTYNTTMVANVSKLSGTSPVVYTVLNNELYFTAYGNEKGSEIWKYDGANVAKITNFSTSVSASLSELTAVGTSLFFVAKTPDLGFELYRYSPHALTIDKMSSEVEIQFYPNPGNEVAHLKIKLSNNSVLAITITDISGKLVFETGKKRYNASTQVVDIPTDGFIPGFYTYSIRNETGQLIHSGKWQKR